MNRLDHTIDSLERKEYRSEEINKVAIATDHLMHILRWGIGGLHEDQKKSVSIVQKFLAGMVKTFDLIEEGKCPKGVENVFGEFMAYQGYNYGNMSLERQKIIVLGAVRRTKWGAEDLELLKKDSGEFYQDLIKYDRTSSICKGLISFFDDRGY